MENNKILFVTERKTNEGSLFKFIKERLDGKLFLTKTLSKTFLIIMVIS